MHERSNSIESRPWTWSMGRIAGIPTGVHASFLLLLAWVAYTAISSGGSLAAVMVSLVFTLTIFASVLLHEFGHALVARSFGIETESITLYPLGGVARLSGTPGTPRAGLWVALAGPAVNIVLAAAGLVLQIGLGWMGTPALITSFVGAFIYANVGLALFNMLPAFPMDGGRVLRAALQRKRGLLEATEIAVKIGKGFAVVFGIAGLVYNPMLLLIAPFVWFAADRELAHVRRLAAMAAEVLRRRKWVDAHMMDRDPSVHRGWMRR